MEVSADDLTIERMPGLQRNANFVALNRRICATRRRRGAHGCAQQQNRAVVPVPTRKAASVGSPGAQSGSTLGRSSRQILMPTVVAVCSEAVNWTSTLCGRCSARPASSPLVGPLSRPTRRALACAGDDSRPQAGAAAPARASYRSHRPRRYCWASVHARGGRGLRRCCRTSRSPTPPRYVRSARWRQRRSDRGAPPGAIRPLQGQGRPGLPGVARGPAAGPARPGDRVVAHPTRARARRPRRWVSPTRCTGWVAAPSPASASRPWARSSA